MHSKRQELLAVAVLVVFGLLVLHPALSAQFVLVDDHEILSLAELRDGSDQWELGLHLPDMVLVSDPTVGRFRPLYWTLRFGEVAAFGDDAAAYHVVGLVLGLLAATLVYFTARTLGAGQLPALLLGGWLLVAPGISSLWVRLGADDTLATFLLTLSVFASARAARGRHTVAWDALFVSAGLGAILTKESFALAAPALAAFRVLLGVRSGALRLRGLPLSAWAILVVCGASMAVSLVVGSAGSDVSHGGRYFVVPELGPYTRSVAQNAAIIAYVGVAWVAPLVLVGLARRRAWTAPVVVSLLALLLIVPQVLLYSIQGIMEGKYEDIAGLGVAAWMMAGLVLLGQMGSRRIYPAGLALWAATIMAFGLSTWSYATFFTQESLQLQRLVRTVTAVVPTTQGVGIAADAGRQYEPVVSLIEHISYQARSDVQANLVALPSDRPYTQIEASLDDSLRQQIPPPDMQTCRGIGAVVVLGNEAAAHAALPCAGDFQRVEFSSEVWLWGGEGVSLRPRLPGTTRVGYVLLLPPDASLRNLR